jgi:hypothetical protein
MENSEVSVWGVHLKTLVASVFEMTEGIRPLSSSNLRYSARSTVDALLPIPRSCPCIMSPYWAYTFSSAYLSKNMSHRRALSAPATSEAVLSEICRKNQ